MGHRVTVVSGGKVSVERSDDGVFLSFSLVVTFPLANSRTARVGHEPT